MDDPGSPYLEGYEAASNPEPLKCPHPHGTAESEQWRDGVGDGLSAMVELSSIPDEPTPDAVAIAAEAIREAEDDVASRHGVERLPLPVGVAVLGLLAFAVLI